MTTYGPYGSRSRRGGRSSSSCARSSRPIGTTNISIGSGRVFLPLVIFALIAAVCFCKLFYLQVVMAEEYSGKAEATRTQEITTTPKRGTIYDRNGNILAISVDATTVYANPSVMSDEDARGVAANLAAALGGSYDEYLDKLSDKEKKWVLMERQAVVAEGDLPLLDMPGIYCLEDSRREYPYGKIGGQVVGLCETQDEEGDGFHGLSGLELYYDDVLCGTPGVYVAERGIDGTPIPGGVHEQVPVINGQDIMVSIDIEMQEYLEECLLDTKERLASGGASGIILDAETGEILAAASLPLCNPGDRSTYDPGSEQVKAITQAQEPGSVFKAVSVLSILKTGLMTPDTVIWCPEEVYEDQSGFTFSDASDRDAQDMSLREILNRSSNVGISLSVRETGVDKFYEELEINHFGEATGVDYPMESNGVIGDFDEWSKMLGYTATFGQGVSASGLQIARFYGAVLNDGEMVTPHFLVKNLQTGEGFDVQTEQVIEDQAVDETLRDMLRTVVTDGTGRLADIDGYDVCGKTSTAQIASASGGYQDENYNCGFAGFIDNASSKLVCYVCAEEVPNEAAVTPVFHDIMSFAIDRFGIVAE